MVARSGARATPAGRPPLTLAYRNAVRTVRPLMRALTRQDWQGAQHLPREGGCVVAANHISHADPFAVAHFLFDNGHPPFFLGKASLFEVPLLGRWLGATQQIPVHRGDGRAADAYRDAVAAVRAGRCVVIMPESTITKDPQGWPMIGKTGAARIALEVGAPVLPLAQWGARELLDADGTFRPWRRPTMHMALGAPVPLDDLRMRPMSGQVLRMATARIMAAITAGVGQLRGEQPPTHVWDRAQGRRVPAPEVGMDQGMSG